MMERQNWRPGKQETVVEALKHEFNELFERFWSGQMEPMQLGRWTPAVDVSETEEAVLVHVEIPGVEASKVEILVENDVLTIRGEKQELPHEPKQEFLRVERRYGPFVRSVRLPGAVSADRAEARSREGVLEIRLPKQEESRMRKVNISMEG
jgi:HSP20 family protein